MTANTLAKMTLTDLGWNSHFQGELKPDETVSYGRVSEVHRDRVIAFTPTGEVTLAINHDDPIGQVAVGDWVAYHSDRVTVARVLDRKTSLRRKAPGSAGEEQMIAANVDTLFIVTSCNADFNPARLERYLMLASMAEIMPVIVLTKADLNTAAGDLRRQAERLSPLATAITVNALDADTLAPMLSWLKPGETGALVGSSGVGKSTILNMLTGAQSATQGVREDDAKGRHTTTARYLRKTHAGGWLIDTPGIRQLAFVDAADAIDDVFADIATLAQQCKFSDCAHNHEPGCAVTTAIAAGTLDAGRLTRWRKLHLEDLYSAETTEETRARQKTFSRQVRKSIGAKPKRRR